MNRLGDRTADGLARALAADDWLGAVNLRGNNVSHCGVAALRLALEQGNDALCALDLRDNRVQCAATQAAVDQLDALLRQRSTMDSAGLLKRQLPPVQVDLDASADSSADRLGQRSNSCNDDTVEGLGAADEGPLAACVIASALLRWSTGHQLSPSVAGVVASLAAANGSFTNIEMRHRRAGREGGLAEARLRRQSVSSAVLEARRPRSVEPSPAGSAGWWAAGGGHSARSERENRPRNGRRPSRFADLELEVEVLAAPLRKPPATSPPGPPGAKAPMRRGRSAATTAGGKKMASQWPGPGRRSASGSRAIKVARGAAASSSARLRSGGHSPPRGRATAPARRKKRGTVERIFQEEVEAALRSCADRLSGEDPELAKLLRSELAATTAEGFGERVAHELPAARSIQVLENSVARLNRALDELSLEASRSQSPSPAADRDGGLAAADAALGSGEDGDDSVDGGEDADIVAARVATRLAELHDSHARNPSPTGI
mmetsp:Transcript_11399/g.32373  ORF Transcript_11399/g.32373 Transcript_11399/m.32373 type:complete len:492 (-) Transcript_11399:876-2351(-)